MSALPATPLAAAPAPHLRTALFETLASERKTAPREERVKRATGDDFTFVDRTWVTLWYDPQNAVRSDCGGMTAYRAITTTGDLLWYVAPEGEAPVYHAQCADPFEAIEHATVALGAQSDLNRRWAHIERLASDLRQGIIHFDVTLADARLAPICPLGFKAMMASVGLFGATSVSGRTAAMLMRIEPTVGFVIHAAWLRAQGTAPATHVATKRSTPVGFESIC